MMILKILKHPSIAKMNYHYDDIAIRWLLIYLIGKIKSVKI